MSKIAQNIQLCDTLVYRYLVENRHYKTAKLLKKEREKDYTLEVKKGEKISKIFSYLITKYGQSQLELDSVSNCLVYDYLKNHENQKIQKLAEKLKALVPPIQTKSENPSIGDVLNHAKFARKILVPARKNFSNQLPKQAQAKRQTSSIKEVSDIGLNSKEDLTTTKVKDEDRFRQCTKFEVTCNCGEVIVLDGITRGSGKDLQLALQTCPNLSCQRRPLAEKFVMIKNKLVLAIRHHVQKYYASWIICEDPGCSGRTRRLALAFQRAFPICTTCYKATMYREYTESQLYTQLLYLQTLFNLHKLSDTHPDYQNKFKLDDAALKQYNDCYSLVKKEMLDNKYCMVSLSKVFEGFFPRAADCKKGKSTNF